MKVRIRWNSRGASAPPPPVARQSSPEPEPGIIGGLMLAAFGASDPGCVRSNNEDYFLVDPSLGLYLVADGMGGAQAGEHASKLAVETVREVVGAALAKGTANGDPRILSMEGMGTTLVAALENKGELLIANVGDSRLYLFENGRLHSITEDQTWVNEVGRRLGLDEESLKTHPMRHVLTMAIGVSDQLRVHTYMLKPAPGMQVLLCSDGLHGVASEEDVAGILGSEKSLDAKCDGLIEAARAQGGPDNITAVILQPS
jgi:PPM family protein phosphatase